MIQKNGAHQKLPSDMAKAIRQVGERLRIARKRRAMPMKEMASRMFVSRKTLSRLENGDPGVSLAVLSSALWVLGLEKDLLELAHPERDVIGIFRERQRLPKRIRSSVHSDEPDF